MTIIFHQRILLCFRHVLRHFAGDVSLQLKIFRTCHSMRTSPTTHVALDWREFIGGQSYLINQSHLHRTHPCTRYSRTLKVKLAASRNSRASPRPQTNQSVKTPTRAFQCQFKQLPASYHGPPVTGPSLIAACAHGDNLQRCSFHHLNNSLLHHLSHPSIGQLAPPYLGSCFPSRALCPARLLMASTICSQV